MPKMPSNFDSSLRAPNFLRRTDKPILTYMPDGPSYTLRRNLVEWQNFKIRIGCATSKHIGSAKFVKKLKAIFPQIHSSRRCGLA